MSGRYSYYILALQPANTNGARQFNARKMSAKTSISILEELASRKKIEKPQYSTSMVPGGYFKCEVKCGDGEVLGSAIACNKKSAKHECAKQALLKLQYLIDLKLEPSNVPTVTPKEHEECDINAVGTLNEMCSQNGVAYPEYIDCATSTGSFIVNCKCLSYTTSGRSTTKKKAKQLSAKEMLEKLHPSDFKEAMSEVQHAEIIQKYKELKERNSATEVKESNPHTNALEDKITQGIDNLKLEPNVVKFLSEEEIHKQLVNLGIKYTVQVYQELPLILLLQARGPSGAKYTFLESKPSYSECRAALLNFALDAIKILIVED